MGSNMAGVRAPDAVPDLVIEDGVLARGFASIVQDMVIIRHGTN